MDVVYTDTSQGVQDGITRVKPLDWHIRAYNFRRRTLWKKAFRAGICFNWPEPRRCCVAASRRPNKHHPPLRRRPLRVSPLQPDADEEWRTEPTPSSSPSWTVGLLWR